MQVSLGPELRLWVGFIVMRIVMNVDLQRPILKVIRESIHSNISLPSSTTSNS